MRRTHGLILASVLLLGVAGLALSSPAGRARLPWMPGQVQALLEQTPCGQDPQLSEAQLIAALRRDLRDPCGRLDAAILEHPATERWLQTQVLGELPGPESLRLRAAQSLARRDDGELAARELRSGHLGPESRQALLRTLDEKVDALPVPFDPTGRSAAARFSRGDWSARAELADAIYLELRWPTQVDPASAPEQLGTPQALVDGALAGLGWSSEVLAETLVELRDGRPTQALESASLRLLQRGGSDCSSPDPACLSFLLAELDSHADPLPPPAAPLAGLHLEDQELFERAAESVRSAENPEGRLLSLVAHPSHSYGARAWSAGQRGEPALVLRHGGGPPAGTASAALALGEASGVPVQVYGGDSDTLRIEVGSRRATVGPCGPGSGTPSGDLPQLSADEVRAWALRERVAGLAAAGDLEGAVLASAAEDGQVGTPQWTALRAGLLACQGIRLPGLSTPGEAALWARACGQQELAQTLELESAPPRAVPACSSSLGVPLPRP